MAKPSQSEVSELSRLFPNSFTSGSGKGHKRRFDPNDPLKDVIPDKNKKKKGRTSQGRSLKITVCRLPSFCKSVPRGKTRGTLKNEGRIVDMQFTRTMTAEVVRVVINRGFQSDQGNSWRLDMTTNCVNQNLNGEGICSRRGCLYIVDKQVRLRGTCTPIQY